MYKGDDMADYQSTIELRAVTRDIDRKLNAVRKNLNGVTKQVKKAQTSFKKMSKGATSSLKKLDAKVKSSKLAIAGFAASFALLAGSSVKAFKDWEDGLNQIATLGVKKMGMVIDQLKSLRREYGITGKEATKGYYDIVSAGAKAGAEAMEQLTAATQLAKAGNTDLDKAVKIVTSGVKVFAEQGETATSIIDKLFLAVKYGKTTVAELGNQFGLVAPIMKSAGLGMSDYAAAMAAITAGSIETTVATTGLKAIMSNIVKVTPKAAKAAARLGIDFSVTALKAKGFVGFMQDIKEKTGGSITEIGQLFESIEAINAVAVLTSDAGIADLIRNFDAMKNSAGTVKEAMDIIKDSFSFNWGILTQQMKIMSESIGSALVPALISFASAISPIIEFISVLILQHPGIVKLTAAVTAFALAWAFLGAPVALIITGIVVGLKLISSHFELFESGGAHAFNIVGDHFRRFIILLGRSNLVQIFKNMYTSATKWIGKIVTYISGIKWVSAVFDGLNAAIEKVKKWFKDLWTYLVGASVIPDIVNGINLWFSEKKLTFLTGLEALVKKVEALFDRLYATTQKTGEGDGDILGLEKATGSSDALNIVGAGIITLLAGINTAIASVDLAKLQKLIQSSRELAAAVSDDFAKDYSTDKKQGARAVENAAAGRTAYITQRIKDLRTLGKELGDLQLKSVNAELEKLYRNLEMEGKIKSRGMLSQALFGEGTTLLSFGEKANALVIKLDGLVLKLIRKLDTALIRFDAIGTKAAGVDASAGITPDSTVTEKVKGTGKGTGSGQTTTRTRTIEEIKAGDYKWYQALKQALKAFADVAKGHKLRFQTLTVLLEATYVKISNGMSRMSATFGAVGRFLAKIPGMKAIAPGALLKSLTKTRIFRAVAFIGKKILIPLVAVYDAYKGFTDLDRISEITGVDTKGIKVAEENLFAAQEVLESMSEGSRMYSDQQAKIAILAKAVGDAEDDAGLTTGKRAISAASNAIGNFFSGFAHLGGIVAEFADLGLTADVLKNVDLAPTFRKVFEVFINLFETFKNFFANDEDGAGILDTTLSAVLSGALNTIIGAIDVIHKVSLALKALSEGDLGGVVKHLGRAIKTIFNYILSILPGFDFDTLQANDQKKYDSTDAEEAREDAEEKVKDLTNELADLSLGTEEYAKKQVELKEAQIKLTTSAEKAAIALAALGKEEFGRYGRKSQASTIVNSPVTGAEVLSKNYGIKTKASGGPISGAGSGTSDSIPAMLSNGEFVINAKAAKGNKRILELINSGKLKGFASGGPVAGKFYDYATGKQGKRSTGDDGQEILTTRLDLTNIKEMIDTLGVGTEEWKKLIVLLDDASSATKDLTYEEAKGQATVADLNKALLVSSLATENLGLQVTQTEGSIRALGDTTEKTTKTIAEMQGGWAGTFKSFTDPLKSAIINLDGFDKALEQGAKSLLQTIQQKLLDRTTKPIEDGMDAVLNKIFGDTSDPDGSSIAKALYVRLTGDSSVLDQITQPLQELAHNPHGAIAAAIDNGTNTNKGLFSNLGSIFSNGLSGLGSLFSGGGDGMGGLIQAGLSLFGFAKGGIVPKMGQQPQYFAQGGLAKGTDTIPAMLTPGEMVLNKAQQNSLGNTTVINNKVEISGNVDDRAIEQIRQVMSSSPDAVYNANSQGQDNNTGLRRRR